MTSQRARRQAVHAAHAAIGLALALALHAGHAAEPCSSADIGRAIFTGECALPAHLRDDKRGLPPATTRCVNCHAGTDRGAPFAPRLTRGYLLDPVHRRGGPPSAYDEQNFCRVLRDGVDPASVIVAKAMPRYEISDSECASMWRYLVEQKPDAMGAAATVPARP